MLLINKKTYTKSQSRASELPSIQVLGDLNFRDIVWPDGINKNKTTLNQCKRQELIDIMNDLGLEQLIQFPTREENTLDLIIISLLSFRICTSRINSVIMILLQTP